MSFYLVQRGKFRNNGAGLTGRNGVVDLDYMGSSEFEFGAIPMSFRRLMYNFNDYDYKNTGVYTPENDELIMFTDNDLNVNDVIYFINNPYHLKEYSELEKIKTSHIYETGFKKRRSDFWWCIDQGRDWMAFLNSNRELFEKAINYDYNSWWLEKTKEQREEEYVKSLRRF